MNWHGSQLFPGFTVQIRLGIRFSNLIKTSLIICNEVVIQCWTSYVEVPGSEGSNGVRGEPSNGVTFKLLIVKKYKFLTSNLQKAASH